MVAFMAGTWVLHQNNGGPSKLEMDVSKNGEISLKLDKIPLAGFTGAIFASKPNEDGQYPVIMTIYSASSSSDMGLSITNYTGALMIEEPHLPEPVKKITGTAIGTGDYSSPKSAMVQVFSWTAEFIRNAL